MNAAIRRTWRFSPATGFGRFFSTAFRKWPAITLALLFAVRPALAVDTITTRSATAGNPSGLWSDTSICSPGQG